MPPDVTVVIPVDRSRTFNKGRALHFKSGTPVLIAEHDEGEYAGAVNQAVRLAETPFVLVSQQDVWFEQHDGYLDPAEVLPDLAWDCDATWGPSMLIQGDQHVGTQGEGMFCPVRLTRENYIPSVFCVRKNSFLDGGGMESGAWEFHNRLVKKGARYKYVPEAASMRDDPIPDPSPQPEPAQALATFYHQATPGTSYWRCVVPSRHLPAQLLFNMPIMRDKDDFSCPNHVGKTAVFQFTGDVHHHNLTLAMQAQGIRVLIEVDDNYSHWFPGVMKRTGWSEHIGEAGYSVEGHNRTVGKADGVIVTTELLAKQYRRLNDNVYVCGNQIDPADWPQLRKPDDGIFRIGWFASKSHDTDSKLVERALAWASEQPNVEVNLIGINPHQYKMRRKHFQWSNDFGVYRTFLMNFDVGLAPVVASPWAQNRSDLKALEYGMAGALPVVSDCAPYDTVDVPKAKTARDFLRIVQDLVRDREGTRERALQWRDYVLEHRTIDKNIDKWKEAVAG